LVSVISKVNVRSILFPALDLSWKSISDRLFLVLFVADLVLRTIWLDKPSGSLIFDEWYYVNVARVILRLPQSVGADGKPPYVDPALGLDPNHEHPPLAKLIIALSMYLFGDNGFGWRIPSVIFGAVAILVFYLLMKKLTVHKWLPLIATFLFSFDNLIFVQSRIAILDIFTLTFMLIGFYWYFSGHTYLSAVGMALSTLTKATGGAGFIVIVALHAARFIRDNLGKGKWSELFSWFEKYLIVYVASFLMILAVLDVQWVGFSNPVDHIRFILDYSSRLTSTCPNGIISCPWQWLINQIPIPYLTVNVDVTSGNVTRSFQSIAFVGAMNPAILYLTIPAMLYVAYDCYKKKGDYSLFILIWFSITYLPYYPAVLAAQRVTYLFYFLVTMPAVCAGVAYMISEQNPPKLVVLFYLAVVAVSFYWMFPFKVIPS